MQQANQSYLFMHRPVPWLAAGVVALAAVVVPVTWAAGNYPVTAAQRATADQVAKAGVPLSELAPNAPDRYTIKPGDTLWAISRLYLRSPWRWPELWGMNRDGIRNPHLIYPGQQLVLVKIDGRAQLRLAGAEAGEPPVVHMTPRTRVQKLAVSAIPTLQSHLIEPFLVEPLVVDATTLQAAPRIVASQEEGRVLVTRGDRAYVRSSGPEVLTDDPTRKQKAFRVFRDAVPLKDPITQEVLGYEAQYLGRALLARSEAIPAADGSGDIVPATIDIIAAREEMRVGDRLLPEPPPEVQSYTPRAPQGAVDARVVSIYGSAVANAAQNQVLVLNRGSRDGLENGNILQLLRDGARVIDRTDSSLPTIKLPDERNGLLMVFRTFERVSYGLVLEITQPVRVGDRLINPN